MKLFFSKYQGTGNDFILLDNRHSTIQVTNEQVAFLCDRRFGIGADGLMLLENQVGFDYRMVYYNSDGRLSSMCGNGGRCISAFAKRIGIVSDYAHFIAVDGPHEVKFVDHEVSLKMNDVDRIEKIGSDYFLNTGSPHYVRFVQDIGNYGVFDEGKKIRNSERFMNAGTNVNFIERVGERLHVRTYERGVEDETFSCGTGVTAAALIAAITNTSSHPDHCDIETKGGKLKVKFRKISENNFSDIWLEGPAEHVFDGTIDLK